VFAIRMLPFFILLAFVVGPITLIFGHDGHTLERFVAWWCAFSGVTDPAAIATATGTFGALSLLAAVYAVWLLILNVVAHLDHTAGPTN
jgi:hypothetical protein